MTTYASYTRQIAAAANALRQGYTSLVGIAQGMLADGHVSDAEAVHRGLLRPDAIGQRVGFGDPHLSSKALY